MNFYSNRAAQVDGADILVGVPLPANERVFLFLQGHPSKFWLQLHDEVEGRGATALKVHFGLGDVVFWPRAGATHYRGSLQRWEGWLRRFIAKHGVTDIVYYADRFPYHVAAREVAEAEKLGCWCIEFGYLRPDFLTLEIGGMGRYSTFAQGIVPSVAANAPEYPEGYRPKYGHQFRDEAVAEVTFNLANEVGRIAYPRLVTDKMFWPVFDYLSWLPKLAMDRRMARRAAEVQARLVKGKAAFNLVAMQLESDYQVRDNSKYNSLCEFLDEVCGSFAKHAPGNRRLLIKLHPLDSGLERAYARSVRALERHGLTERADVIRGGDLQVLLEASKGAVTINSTVGLHALRAHVPVMALGDAIYEPLTHQHGLNTFWKSPEAVDERELSTFLRNLSAIQVKGSFFHTEGRAIASKEMAKRMMASDGVARPNPKVKRNQLAASGS